MGDDAKPNEPPRDGDSDLTRDLPTTDGSEADKVKGGWSPKAPSPGGPIPIPYPNLPK
jgi:hypothetical protein